MDELEFQKRVYANPEEVDQEVLDAARDNPAYQKILDQARELNAAVTSLVNNISVPSGLADKLGAIPADDEAATKIASKPAANSNFFQYYAIAASLILALGVTFSIIYNNEPAVSDLAFGDDILRHLYYEAAEIESMQSVIALSTVTAVMASAGSQLVANELLQGLSVVMAKPCVILAAYQSTHLVLEGAQGAVNVIVINNGHRDFVYASRFKALQLRYICRLFAKEMVLKNFPGYAPDQLLERMIELSLYTEENLK